MASFHFTRSEQSWLGGALAAAALALLARAVGTATEQLGERLSPGATGVLQGAFGNLPELFVSLFSLKAGLRDVVRAALVGSILANAVLVLGLALLVGGLRHGTQRFDSQPPRTAATLMLLAVTALAVPTLADTLHTPAQPHEAQLSATCALVLLAVFAASLRFTLAGDPAVLPPAPGTADDFEGVIAAPAAHAGWSVAQSLTVLGAAGLGAALVSDWFVDDDARAAADPARRGHALRARRGVRGLRRRIDLARGRRAHRPVRHVRRRGVVGVELYRSERQEQLLFTGWPGQLQDKSSCGRARPYEPLSALVLVIL